MVAGIGPAGAATFALDIEAGARVTYQWQTDIRKAWNGLEQRAGLLAKPRQRYEFTAILTDAQQRQILSTLAAHAHTAPAFLLGLAYEDLQVVSATAGSITVDDLAYCDWAEPGQRIVVVSPDGGSMVNAVVQAAAGATIDVDVDTTAVAVAGARLMPAVGVYLDPDQTLGRYQVNLGSWDIAARADRFRFGSAGTVGHGATVATYDGHPVWDRGAAAGGLRPEPLHAGAELVDLGARVAAIQAYDRADWSRGLVIESSDIADWQWFKLFLDTVHGRRVAFLLATGRPDLVPVGDASSGTLTIEDVPDYAADWYPSLAHRRLQIVKTDGTIAYRKVLFATDNLNGTQSLGLDAALTGAIDRVEFLELVRLETDEITVTWQGYEFRSELAARVVQR